MELDIELRRGLDLTSRETMKLNTHRKTIVSVMEKWLPHLTK